MILYANNLDDNTRYQVPYWLMYTGLGIGITVPDDEV